MTKMTPSMLIAWSACALLLTACHDDDPAQASSEPIDKVALSQVPVEEEAPGSLYEKTPEGQEPRLTQSDIRAAAAAGPSSSLFIDLLDDNENVTSVEVCSDRQVNALTFTTNKRTLPKHGNDGGTCRVISLLSGEQIMRISGTASSTVESMSLATTHGRSFGPYGTQQTGQAYSMAIAGGTQGRFRGLKGFTSAAGSTTGGLTQIGLIDPATGRDGGDPFIDRMAADERVTSVKVCWRPGAQVQTIQLRTNKGQRAKHGTDWADQKCDTTELAANEFITTVFGRASNALDAFGYATNTGRRVGPFGGTGGEGFNETVIPASNRFVGLYGRSGSWMNRIGILSPMASGTQLGNNWFRDTLPAGQSITAVEVCVGVNDAWPGEQVVRSVQAFYGAGNPRPSLPRHGAQAGQAGACHQLVLAAGESIVEMSGAVDKAIGSLRLHTSAGRTFGPYGQATAGSQPFLLRNPHPSFLGFAGRATQPGNEDGGTVLALDFATPDLHAKVAPPTRDAEQQGWWDDVANWPLMGIHLAMLPDGRVMSYGTDTSGVQGAQFSYDVWDPAQPADADNAHLTLPNQLATDMFCSGQSLLNNGTLLLAGGDARNNGFNFGIRATTQFVPSTNGLKALTPMQRARWYANQTVLTDGSVLVMGGTDELGVKVTAPEVFDASSNTWKLLTGVTGTGVTGSYPRAFVTRSVLAKGRAVWVISTSTGRIYRLEVDGNNGTGQLIDSSVTIANHNAQGQVVGSYRWELPATLVDSDQVLVQLSDGSTKLVTLPNKGNLTDKPTVADAGQLSQPRFWSEMVLLPTGDLLAVNGSSSPNDNIDVAYHAELWNRKTHTWSPLASQMRPRLYHSAALLMTDGSVVSVGGGAPGPQNELNAQVFRPPYLYDGKEASARPTFSIADRLTSFDHGQKVNLQTNVAATNIAKVTLVKLGSTTHSQNTEQRFMALPLARGPNANSLSVTLPTAAHMAPSGFYMLTVINNRGVPSVSKIIKLQG